MFKISDIKNAPISEKLALSLKIAHESASQSRRKLCTAEDLLLGMIDDEKVQKVLLYCCVNIEQLRRSVMLHINDTYQSEPQGFVVKTVFSSEAERAIRTAVMRIDQVGLPTTGTNASNIDLLVSLLEQKDSPVASFLHRHGVSLPDVMEFTGETFGDFKKKLHAMKPDDTVLLRFTAAQLKELFDQVVVRRLTPASLDARLSAAIVDPIEYD